MEPGPLLRALVFAADKHRHQRRKGADASPYINHPVAVAAVLAIETGATDEVLLIAAILHDTVEDTNTKLAELENLFGASVAHLVNEVTDNKSLDKAERKRRQIEHASTLSAAAKQLVIADKTCNVRDLTEYPPADWSRDRRREYLDWAEQVVAGCRGIKPELDRIFDLAIGRARMRLELPDLT
jgi:GTP diphosphokinase / guanosine-3',5'-bis(diphosphate) 3'-diphosphatase